MRAKYAVAAIQLYLDEGDPLLSTVAYQKAEELIKPISEICDRLDRMQPHELREGAAELRRRVQVAENGWRKYALRLKEEEKCIDPKMREYLGRAWSWVGDADRRVLLEA